MEVDNSSPRPLRWWMILIVLVAVPVGGTCIRSVTARNARDQADRACDDAVRLAEAGDYQQAQVLATGVLERFPQHARALLLSGECLWQQGQHEQARVQWDRVGNSAGRESARARYLEGDAWLQQRCTIPAENKLRASVELDREYLPPQERLVELYSRQLRSTELRRTLIEIRNLRPLDASELAAGILADTGTGPAAEMLQWLQECAAADPDDIASRVAAAQIQLMQQEPEAALASLEASRNGADARILSGRALVLARLDRLREARGVVSRLAGRTTSPLFRRARGELLEKLGNRPAALADLLTVARMSPFDVGLFQQLGRLCKQVPDEELAEVFLERADRLEMLTRECRRILKGGDSPPHQAGSTALDIADHLLALDHAAFAVEWVQQAQRLVPEHPRLAGLTAQISPGTLDTWNEFLDRATDAYPQRLADSASLELLSDAQSQ